MGRSWLYPLGTVAAALLAGLAFCKQDLERATRSEDRLHRIIGGMLDKERYLINELSDAFMSGRLSDPKQTERELEKHVQHLASDGTIISELTQAVNLQENRIMDRLQEQVPDLSPDELAFCALLAAGLSTGSIRILTAESRSNIYTKKSRIKARILASDAADKEDFLRHFGF